MSQLIKVLYSKPIFQMSRLATAGQIKEAHWFPEYKPGPYPKTEEERKAAAKKYNLLPEEYEPYPDDGDGLGDYPNLPFVSVDAKDPYYIYDHPQLQRDYMEPVHARIINLLPEAMSTNPPVKISHERGTAYFLGLMAVSVAFLLWGMKFELMLPVAKKQLPAPGEKYYTFEIDHVSIGGFAITLGTICSLLIVGLNLQGK